MNRSRRNGWWQLLAVTALYTVAILISTWPRVVQFRSTLPTLTDPLQHLWIMRWYKTCLLEGRLPSFCPEIQCPTGAPLGNFSPLHLQAMLFLPLSWLIGDDILCYNLIWTAGLVFTGVGTFALARRITGDPYSAFVGGLLAMLSGPMALHMAAHLELIYLGGFPLFLIAWTSFVDRPCRATLIKASAAYLLLALCAAYYAVFAIIPAALYVIWRRSWTNVAWLAAFAGMVTPLMALVFANQLWARANGYQSAVPLSFYARYSAPWWSYLTPTVFHRLGRLLSTHPDLTTFGYETLGERASYLGVVTLALLVYAALARVRFPRAGYWWTCLGMLVVLSFGAYAHIGGWEFPLPALWLKKGLVLFAMIRVPARFNLPAAVIAAVIASAGLSHWLAKLPGPKTRASVLAAVVVVAMVDLSIPASRFYVPSQPGCYDAIRLLKPDATIVEVPQFTSSGSELASLTGFWQSNHRLRTSSGYSGHRNVIHDERSVYNSPFFFEALTNPAFLAQPDDSSIDIVHRVSFDDYVWLYLTENHYDYVVVHRSETGVHLDRLACAKVYSDARTTVYDRARLPEPSRPVLMTTEGWRVCIDGQERIRSTAKHANMTVFHPDASRPLRFVFRARAFARPRVVRLRSGEVELARWQVDPKHDDLHVSPDFNLAAGLQTLTLESDGESTPRHPNEQSTEGDVRPYSLRVSALNLDFAPPETTGGWGLGTPNPGP